MFELHEAAAKITSFTVFPENHGATEKDTGNTIGCEVTVAGDVVDGFNPQLRKAIFRKLKAGEQQDMHRDNDGLVALLFPRVGALDWDEEFPGYEASIHANSLFPEPIVLVDVTLKGLSFQGLEGGSIVVRFQLKCHPEPNETGHLSKLLKREAVLTLTPPTKQTTE